jgi:hypothetical protein
MSRKNLNQSKMKKILLLSFITFIMVMSIDFSAEAQSSEWGYIGASGGVSVYWRYRKELKDQYISELKFVNGNSYKVKISFNAYFTCADGTGYNESGQTIYIAAESEKAGQWSGLMYYPCGGTLPPKTGGYKKLIVTEEE